MPTAPASPEYIEAKNDLRQKVRKIRRLSPSDDPVKRAEAALRILSTHFGDWMLDEIRVMYETRDAWRAVDYRNGGEKDAFFRSVHDLKGQSTTLGFPLATRVAASLCQLLERIDNRKKLPISMINNHVDAIRAIVRENATEENDRVGADLVDALVELAAAYVKDHGLPDPDDFNDIFVS